MDPKREPAADLPKLTRGNAVRPLEVHPRVITEPQPMSDAILVQPQLTECLSRASALIDEGFAVELTGRVTTVGRVTEARASGVESSVARCLEVALGDILVLPDRPGAFRLMLTRQSRDAGPGVIIDPAGGKKSE